MKNTSIALLVVICIGVNAEHHPAEVPECYLIEGQLFIWGEHLESKKVGDLEGFSLFIRGKGAERLYKSIQAKPKYNECFVDGTYTKAQGMFACHLNTKGQYSCDLGISTKEGKVYGAEPC